LVAGGAVSPVAAQQHAKSNAVTRGAGPEQRGKSADPIHGVPSAGESELLRRSATNRAFVGALLTGQNETAQAIFAKNGGTDRLIITPLGGGAQGFPIRICFRRLPGCLVLHISVSWE
jgi:hypothetical protein